MKENFPFYDFWTYWPHKSEDVSAFLLIASFHKLVVFGRKQGIQQKEAILGPCLFFS